jgi:hypothetical protein
MGNRQVNTRGHFAEHTMSKPDIIDEIISSLDPESVPPEYIILAKVYTQWGEELILTAQELEDLLDTKPESIVNIKIILDVRKIRRVINQMTDELLQAARRKLLK